MVARLARLGAGATMRELRHHAGHHHPALAKERDTLVHAQSLGGWHADEARSVAVQALELAERNDLTSLAVELHATLDPKVRLS